MQFDIDFVQRLICNEAKGLIRQFGFPKSEREDLEQDLMVDVLRRVQRVKGEVRDARAYLKALVQRCGLNLAKHRTAQKRQQPGCQSLNDRIQGPDGRLTDAAQVLEEERRHAHRGCASRSDQDRLEDSLDIAEVIKRLPSTLRQCAEALMEGSTLSQAAADAGMAPSTLRRALRQHFEAAGFEKTF